MRPGVRRGRLVDQLGGVDGAGFFPEKAVPAVTADKVPAFTRRGAE